MRLAVYARRRLVQPCAPQKCTATRGVNKAVPHSPETANAAPATEDPPCVSGSSSSISSPRHTRSSAVRSALAAAIAGVCAAVAPPQARAEEASALADLERAAYAAYGDRRFGEAAEALSLIIQRAGEEGEPRWREMRAQVLVDAKDFGGAISDYDAVLALLPPPTGPGAQGGAALTTRARVLAGRALAREGLSQWRPALDDYSAALELAAAGGESPDPFIINSIGNCHNSLGEWAEARSAYLTSSEIFQAAKGFRGRGGSTTQRLDGAVFSASNAALMLAQLGDEAGALAEMVRIARRAPGSADMRAALAALYWAQGRPEEAEATWEWACDAISVGCGRYQDVDWLRRVRRWPPAMVARLQDFLTLRYPTAGRLAPTGSGPRGPPAPAAAAAVG